MQTLGETLGRLMRAKNLKLITVAEEVGRLRPKSANNLGGLSKILNDKRRPSANYIETLAVAMKLNHQETVELFLAAGYKPPSFVNGLEITDSQESIEQVLAILHRTLTDRAARLAKAEKETYAVSVLLNKLEEARIWVPLAYKHLKG